MEDVAAYAREAVELAAGHGLQAAVTPLNDPALWGGPMVDERYLLVSALPV